jgi:hypothetical protein
MVLLSLSACTRSVAPELTPDQIKYSAKYIHQEVRIGSISISEPLGYFILARRGNHYCAIKITDFWLDEGLVNGNMGGTNALYESHYLNSTARPYEFVHLRGKLGLGQFKFSIFGHGFALWSEPDIDCKVFEVRWTKASWIHFYSLEERMYNKPFVVNLAPTPWTDINDVDFDDPRLTWYTYDGGREDITIPINELWPDE